MDNFYNPDFFDIFCKDTFTIPFYKDVCLYLNHPTPDKPTNCVLKKFIIAKDNWDTHKELLDEEEAVKSYYQKWYNESDKNQIMERIQEEKEFFERMKDVQVTPWLG